MRVVDGDAVVDGDVVVDGEVMIDGEVAVDGEVVIDGEAAMTPSGEGDAVAGDAIAGEDVAVSRGDPGDDDHGGAVANDPGDGFGDFGGIPPARAAGGASAGRRRNRAPLISAIVVACVTALLVAVLATSKSATNQSASVVKSPLQNKPAPPISGANLDGGTVSLSSYRGKWVLVNFFASWCVPCRQEQNDLVRFQNAHSSGDAVIFGVRFQDPDIGPIEQMMRKSGAKWPIIQDPDASIDYGVTGPPESFLISPGGIVLAHIIGPTTEPQLETLLDGYKLLVTTPASSTPASSTPASSTPRSSPTDSLGSANSSPAVPTS